MPYIRAIDRDDVDHLIKDMKWVGINNPGKLNYLITMLCKTYLIDNNLNYQTINDVVGALEGAKLEFYRRVAAPYEDIKIKENGDVY